MTGTVLLRESMIIIGAGVAGLAAGIYARLNGYRTTILERHDRPGGLCTAWTRKGYTFDYSIHNLAGTAPGTPLRAMWDQLGAFEGLEIVDHPELVRVEAPDGRSFTVFADIDRMVEELRRASPQDEAMVRDYERTIRRFADMNAFAVLASDSRLAKLSMLPRLPMLAKQIKLTMSQYASGFSDAFLRRAFPVTQYGMPDIPMAIH